MKKTTRDLTKKQASFLWFEMLIEALVNTSEHQKPSTSEAKNQMLNECRSYYKDNKTELIKIEQFHNCYSPDQVIKWYTKQSFVHRLVNKALRTENIDINLNKSILKFYRGQTISIKEFNKLKNSTGSLISLDGF
ncbi:unnamed protein product [Didymodactylos carnosus]|uniref:Uncharacterized protein n=1 Tax=Didymodactylos carnosus TaxID=1234261 RepID=A0A815U4U4_9BILA|nr:unnamed protein product [Didymodactylos carnosus]CAF4375919.1 unnamed protein product [Didymodactylos carnosus]